ncbi:SOS response-associated peptidase [Caloramator sp. ALD01]|uniref:SOS response-associated peptidase n=1 Tax=Caloramator sp. ALD01 TaxID=1031288 RepID=UPI0004221368|nr:SOS response-associated peptidase [Caloramator sp. ALD01]
MCGRVILESDFQDILKRYMVQEYNRFEYKKGEGFPGDNLPVIIKENKKMADVFLWGFLLDNKRVINARSETILDKPLFKNAFLTARCIVPVNGFFEWKNEKGKKIKYRITLKDEDIFSLAGIYRDFKDKDGSIKRCVTILTTEPNDDMREIHNRMPVIIDEKDEELYLYEGFDKSIMDLLKPFENGRLVIKREDRVRYENVSFL